MEKNKVMAISEVLRCRDSFNSYFSCKVSIYDSNFNIIDKFKIDKSYGYGTQPNHETKKILDKTYNDYVLKVIDYGYTTIKNCKNFIFYK